MNDLIQFPLNVLDTQSAYLDNNGKLLANGRLVIYEDNTSTKLAKVYSEMTLKLNAQIPNPVMLDSSGRTATGLYTENPVFVSVERLLGKNNIGEDTYVKIYDFETHKGLELNLLLNSNYVETRTDLAQVTNKNPTWVINEGNPHLYIYKEQNLSNPNGVTRVSAAAGIGQGYWYWDTKEIYADQAGINNKGVVNNANQWALLSKLSMDFGYKIIIPTGTYEFNNVAIQGALSFKDLEIQSGVEFEHFRNWIFLIEDNVECFSPLTILWSNLPKGKIYDRKFFINISNDSTMNYIRSNTNNNIYLKSGNVQTNKLTATELDTPKLTASNGAIENLNISTLLSAKDAEITDLEVTNDMEVNHDLTIHRFLKVKQQVTVGDQIFNEGKHMLSLVYTLDTEAPLASGIDLRDWLNRYFPVGSYLVTYRDNLEPINTLYWLHKFDHANTDLPAATFWFDVTINIANAEKDLNPNPERPKGDGADFVFRNCGLTGTFTSPLFGGHKYCTLIRRIQ